MKPMLLSDLVLLSWFWKANNAHRYIHVF